MNVSDKNAKIWRKDIESKNGTFYRYSVGVSKKDKDGNYINTYIPVMFSKKSGAPEKISNGAICDFEGFMSVDGYKGKDGALKTTPMIVIMSVEFTDDIGEVGFTQTEEEIPF